MTNKKFKIPDSNFKFKLKFKFKFKFKFKLNLNFNSNFVAVSICVTLNWTYGKETVVHAHNDHGVITGQYSVAHSLGDRKLWWSATQKHFGRKYIGRLVA